MTIDLQRTNKVLPGWAANLKRLRGFGVRRTASSSAYAALKYKLARGSVVLDIGCGDSNDRSIAERRGMIAYGVDLFQPLQRSSHRFIYADARRLPFASATFDAVICQAVIALIPPDDRYGFYAEAARVLKPHGLLSITICSLSDGWRVNAEEESLRIAAAEFGRVRSGLYHKGENNV